MLTQLQIAAAKPKTKPYTFPDGQGLALHAQPSGAKPWRFRYRYGGRSKALHVGPWPTISLADAREKCREARKAIVTGIDPALEKKRAKIMAQSFRPEAQRVRAFVSRSEGVGSSQCSDSGNIR